ncbi:ABC-2 type transporter-domain-containing protein [Xylaria sp. FL0064]|nr:ABC-2 type transporter-domain-containing protein [Xylaria sp. FL0064]
MYSWYTFITSSIIVELPSGIFASLLIFFPYYYPVGIDKNAIPSHTVTERGGLMFFILITFSFFQSTFANMCIAGVETAELGGILSLFLFALTLIFCGVIVPRASLPGFWIFLYRVSPFTYIIGAMLSTGLGRLEVQCDKLELLTFQPPQGQTCGEYVAHFPVGALYNENATSNRQFCPLTTTDEFLASVDNFYDQKWRNLGLLFAYIAFNVVTTFFLYWIARVPKKTSWNFITNPLKRKGV